MLTISNFFLIRIIGRAKVGQFFIVQVSLCYNQPEKVMALSLRKISSNSSSTRKPKKPSYPLSIKHSATRLKIKIRLQNFRKDEVHLHITEDTVHLNAVHKIRPGLSVAYESIEGVNRIFTIPPDTIVEKIKATFQNHEVEITLPKLIKKSPGSAEFRLLEF